MQIKYLVAVVAIWVVAALLSGVSEGGGIDASEESTIETLMSFSVFEIKDVFGVLPFPVPNADWFSAFVQMFLWDFAMFEGSYAIVRWVFLMPLSIAMGIMLCLTLIQIVRGS